MKKEKIREVQEERERDLRENKWIWTQPKIKLVPYSTLNRDEWTGETSSGHRVIERRSYSKACGPSLFRWWWWLNGGLLSFLSFYSCWPLIPLCPLLFFLLCMSVRGMLWGIFTHQMTSVSFSRRVKPQALKCMSFSYTSLNGCKCFCVWQRYELYPCLYQEKRKAESKEDGSG